MDQVCLLDLNRPSSLNSSAINQTRKLFQNDDSFGRYTRTPCSLLEPAAHGAMLTRLTTCVAADARGRLTEARLTWIRVSPDEFDRAVARDPRLGRPLAAAGGDGRGGAALLADWAGDVGSEAGMVDGRRAELLAAALRERVRMLLATRRAPDPTAAAGPARKRRAPDAEEAPARRPPPPAPLPGLRRFAGDPCWAAMGDPRSLADGPARPAAPERLSGFAAALAYGAGHGPRHAEPAYGTSRPQHSESPSGVRVSHRLGSERTFAGMASGPPRHWPPRPPSESGGLHGPLLQPAPPVQRGGSPSRWSPRQAPPWPRGMLPLPGPEPQASLPPWLSLPIDATPAWAWQAAASANTSPAYVMPVAGDLPAVDVRGGFGAHPGGRARPSGTAELPAGGEHWPFEPGAAVAMGAAGAAGSAAAGAAAAGLGRCI